MKKIIAVALVALLAAGVAQANLLTNPNFDLDASGVLQIDTEVAYDLADVQAWEGTAGGNADRDNKRGEAHLTADMAWDFGSWTPGLSSGYVKQDSGVIALADTQYTFSIDLDSAACWMASIGFQTAEVGNWGAVGSVSTAFAPAANAWVNYSFVLDTAVNPEFVGESIGVIVQAIDDDGGFLQATNASMTVIPEPATALLFGIGGMGAFIIRRNKKQAQEETDA